MEAFVLRVVRSLKTRDRNAVFIFAHNFAHTFYIFYIYDSSNDWCILCVYPSVFFNVIRHYEILRFTMRFFAKTKKVLHYFSRFEWCLWIFSVVATILSFLLSGDFYPLTLVASLLGVTSLIFIAKGNVIGQFIIIVFSLIYGVISMRSRYYGEMITYVFMSAPAAIFACVSWLKHPSKQGKAEVKIAALTKKKFIYVCLLNAVVSVLFYFILKYFHTANLILSTISVTTSFFAASLLFLRSPYYAVAYATNDVVLIGLWVIESFRNPSCIPMVVCFLAFLANDLYGFYNWKRMQARQKNE